MRGLYTTIADGANPPKMPATFSTVAGTYATMNWWDAGEVLMSHGKRMPDYAEFAALAYGAILGRWLDTPVLNLGFSGNGDMAPAFIDLLCELNPAVYVLDCLPNMTAPLVEERVEAAIRKLRAAPAATPIVLVELVYCDAFLKPHRLQRYMAANKSQHAVYAKLVREGIGDLHYILGEGLIGTDGEATIDGTHYTDLGFVRFAEKLYQTLRPMAENQGQA